MKKILRKVIRGRRCGKFLGYPTINLRYYKKDKIKFGVWAVRARVGRKFLKGAANVGPIPSFSISKPAIEIHLFNFSKNLYNKVIQAEFLKYLRPTKKFRDKKSLVVQIKRDCEMAKKFYSAHGGGK